MCCYRSCRYPCLRCTRTCSRCGRGFCDRARCVLAALCDGWCVQRQRLSQFERFNAAPNGVLLVGGCAWRFTGLAVMCTVQATDVAARGLDIPGVRYVVNYNIPSTGAERRNGASVGARQPPPACAHVQSSRLCIVRGGRRARRAPACALRSSPQRSRCGHLSAASEAQCPTFAQKSLVKLCAALHLDDGIPEFDIDKR